MKLLKITNIFILSRAISAHLIKLVKSSSKSSIQRKKSFDEKNFDEYNHEKSYSQRESVTTSNSSAQISAQNIVEFNMSLRLVEEKENISLQDTLFIFDSRESEIVMSCQDNDSRSSP